MMNEKDVVDFLKKVEEAGIEIWICGGWGVDALLGEQKRPHDDIDIFVQKENSAAFEKMLMSNGYSEIKEKYTNDNPVWCDADNHMIDIHLFEFSEAGTLCYDNKFYPSDILDGRGTIAGISVRCMTAEAQLWGHQGYEHTEKDLYDLQLLCKTFGLSIPFKPKPV